MVERGNKDIPLTIQANLLTLNRTSLYYKPVPPSEAEVAIKHLIDEIYTKHPYYGSRRIAVTLRKRHGISINRKRVQGYMREMSITGICPGPNLSKRNIQHRVYPYLLRNYSITYPNQVWGIDITYIRLKHGWMYLVAIIDWFSRYVVSWQLDQSLEMPFVLEVVDQALGDANPTIINSDQGSHFTSPQYINMVSNAGVKISMDGKGRALDNIITERLWRSVKYEEVYLNEYTSPREARRRIKQYFELYNNERPHQSLNYQTPAEVYFSSTLDEQVNRKAG